MGIIHNPVRHAGLYPISPESGPPRAGDQQSCVLTAPPGDSDADKVGKPLT